MSSNVGQNYPYTSETEAERLTAVESALSRFDGLRDKVSTETTLPGAVADDDRWWIWVCPADGFTGRLHVAGYARERRAMYTVCDTCGKTFLR